MRRIEKRLFRIADRLAELAEEEQAVREELDMHRYLHDDARQDAAIGNYIDGEEAGLVAGDVARFERALAEIGRRRARLSESRRRLLEKLNR